VCEAVEDEGRRRIDALERELATIGDRLAQIETLLGAPAGRRTPSAPATEDRTATSPATDAFPARTRRPEAVPAPTPATRAARPTAGAAPPAARAAPPTPPATPARPPLAAPSSDGSASPLRAPSPPTRARPAVSLEDRLGTPVLAALGGGAVFIGIAFFVAVAIGRGWIGEVERMALAAIASLAMLVLGTWLYERRGRTQAALALTGTAIGSLYLTLIAATSLYDLVPTAPALALAFAVGAIATALAVRWQSQLVATLGIVGALLAPLLIGAPVSGAVALFVLIALAAAAAVLVAERWDWLAIAAFAISAPQIAAFALGPAEPVGIVLAAVALWGLGTAAALGFELRTAAATLRPSSALLVALSAVTAAAIGHLALRETGETGLADLWLAALAIAQLGVAIAARASPRASREIGLLSAGQAVVLGDLAFGLAVGGPALPIGWAAAALALTQLPRALVPSGRLTPDERTGLELSLGAHLMLAIAHVLLFEAPPSTFSGGLADPPGAALALGSLAVSAALCARFTAARPLPRDGFDAVAMAALAWLTAGVLDGVALAVAFALHGLALAEIARRSTSELAAAGACAFLVLAFVHGLAFDAPIDELAGAEQRDLLGGVTALSAACGSALASARLVPQAGLAQGLEAAAVAGLAYLAAFVLDGALVVLAWAVLVGALTAVARARSDQLAPLGALALLLLGVGHALTVEAPPDSLLYGTDGVLAAAVALIALAAAAGLLARGGPAATLRGDQPTMLAAGSDRDETTRDAERGARPLELALSVAAAAMLVYLCSVSIISAFQPDSTAIDANLVDLDRRQQGQLVLSAFWAAAGLAALVAGLVRDARALRLGGFALLGLALAKVVAYDLSTLDSIYRVLSLVGVGLLLLVGAFVYQRLRPQSPDRDLRDVRTP